MSPTIKDDDVTVALLWGDPAAPKRGPKPTLTLDVIAQTSIDLADSEGLETVTMQRVAAALGVTKMALYRYIPGKSQLVALMLDIALGAPVKLRRSQRARTPWRSVLSEWSRRLFQRYCEHPWSLDASLGPRVFGPNELGWLEQALAALSELGLEGPEMFDIVVTLHGHVRGLAQHVTRARGDLPPEQAFEAVCKTVLRGREAAFPALTSALASGKLPASKKQALEFGLDRILDGVEVWLASRK